MRDKRQTIYRIGITLCILLSLTSYKGEETNKKAGQRLATCYTIHMTKMLLNNQTFFQSRDLLCNRKEGNEVLFKSPKYKILVTQQD